jgi:phosphoribosylpyrophosphate synthetase
MDKTYNRMSNGYGYGWAGMPPDSFQSTMLAAGKIIQRLKKKLDFDAVAFSGSSGCAIAFYVAAKYRTPLIYVRKVGENAHGSKVECNYQGDIRKYLIVDDFVSSGATVRHIRDTIKKHAIKSRTECPTPVGIFAYDPSANAYDAGEKLNDLRIYNMDYGKKIVD